MDAMRQTVTNMLGTLPAQFFEVTVTTVGENLAQLMYSVMMTGYMFRNAQYRMELGSSMAALPSKDPGPTDQEEVCELTAAAAAERPPSQPPSVNTTVDVVVTFRCAWGGRAQGREYAPGTQKTRVSGDVLRWSEENGVEPMDAVSYMESLEGEVAALKEKVLVYLPAQATPPPPLTLTPPIVERVVMYSLVMSRSDAQMHMRYLRKGCAETHADLPNAPFPPALMRRWRWGSRCDSCRQPTRGTTPCWTI